jgi:hypothetical protein
LIRVEPVDENVPHISSRKLAEALRDAATIKRERKVAFSFFAFRKGSPLNRAGIDHRNVVSAKALAPMNVASKNRREGIRNTISFDDVATVTESEVSRAYRGSLEGLVGQYETVVRGVLPPQGLAQ